MLQEWQVLDGDLPFPAGLANDGFVPVLPLRMSTLSGRSASNFPSPIAVGLLPPPDASRRNRVIAIGDCSMRAVHPHIAAAHNIRRRQERFDLFPPGWIPTQGHRSVYFPDEHEAERKLASSRLPQDFKSILATTTIRGRSETEQRSRGIGR